MNEEERIEYTKRLEALQFAFKSKELEPDLDLTNEAQSIYEFLNPTPESIT